MLGGGHYSDASSPVQVYASSFYDALQLLQGQGVPTTTTTQSIFASFAVLLGSIVLATVFGHVAVLVSNFNANATNYQRKMEAVFAITSKMQLPEPLRERIHQYYDHLWREYESLDGEIERFSKSLSHTLELEVVLCKYMELVMRVPFWDDCSPDFQKQLMLNLRVRVYLPDDFVIRRGEVDDEFYMISRGSVELAIGPDSFEKPVGSQIIVEEDGDDDKRSLSLDDTSDASDMPPPPRRSSQQHHRGSVYEIPSAVSGTTTRTVRRASSSQVMSASPFEVPAAKRNRGDHSGGHGSNISGGRNGNGGGDGDGYTRTILLRGQAVGEMALLMNYQRTADVRAVTHVEMCVLGRRDFQRILTKHPDDRRRVVTAMLTTTMLNNETHGVHCPLKEMVRAVYEGEEDPASGKSIDAAAAAALILDVINPDVEDTSIKFGVNAHLEQQLLARRDASARVTSRDASARVASRDTSAWAESRDASASVLTGDTQDDAVDPLPTINGAERGLAAEVPSAYDATACAPLSNPPSSRSSHTSDGRVDSHDHPSSPSPTGESEVRIERIERTLDTLVSMVAEMRSAVDRVSSSSSSSPPPYVSATIAFACSAERDQQWPFQASLNAAAAATAAAADYRSERSSKSPPRSRAKSTFSSSSSGTVRVSPAAMRGEEMSARPPSSQVASESVGGDDTAPQAQMRHPRSLKRHADDSAQGDVSASASGGRSGAGGGASASTRAGSQRVLIHPTPHATTAATTTAATAKRTHPPLVRRIGSIVGISQTSTNLLAVSSTPYADQLFKTRPRPGSSATRLSRTAHC